MGKQKILLTVFALALALGVSQELNGFPAAGPHVARAHERGTEDASGLTQFPTCHEVIPDLIEVDYKTARGLVPDVYKDRLVRDAEMPDKVNVIVVTSQCEVRLGAETFQDVINSYWQLKIDFPYDDLPCDESRPESCPDNPPHRSYFRAVPQADSPADSLVESPVGGEFYIFQWVTNNREVAQWLKRGTGLGEEVARYVPDLEFRYNPEPTDPLTGHPARGAVDGEFFFRAPPPATSPFHIGCDPEDPSACAAACATDGTLCEGCEEETRPGCGNPACDYLKTECARATEPYLASSTSARTTGARPTRAP